MAARPLPLSGLDRRTGKMSVETRIERLLTVQDISSLLGVKKSYVYHLTHQRKIPHLKINGHLRFRESDIDEWLQSQEVQIVGIQKEIQKRS